MKKSLKIIIITVLLVASLGFLVFGIVKFVNLEPNYKVAFGNCDLKDYSKYTIEETTPGNEEINKQIEKLKSAMDNAANAGDAVAYGQLREEYTHYLELQSKTSTTTKVKDYDTIAKLQVKCYQEAENEKNTGRIVSIACICTGAILAIFAIVFAIMKH